MNRYRAILIDPEDTTSERPKQIFGNDFAKMQAWAKNTLIHATGTRAKVEVYETCEELAYRITKAGAGAREESFKTTVKGAA